MISDKAIEETHAVSDENERREKNKLDNESFHNAKCQEASDVYGVGDKNMAFKVGANWAVKYIMSKLNGG